MIDLTNPAKQAWIFVDVAIERHVWFPKRRYQMQFAENHKQGSNLASDGMAAHHSLSSMFASLY